MAAGQLFCGSIDSKRLDSKRLLSMVGAAMESRMAPHVVGVAKRLEETSCGWRLWISSGTLGASLAP